MSQNTKNEMIGSFGHLKKSGHGKIIAIGFIIGIALFVIGSLGLVGEKEEPKPDDENNMEGFFEYKIGLEEEIRKICLSVKGISNVEVIVYFEETGGSVYAQNLQSGSMSEKSEYVIIGSGSSARALYLGESLPTLSGIGIVCSAGEREHELCALLAAAYGLPLTRVYVISNG